MVKESLITQINCLTSTNLEISRGKYNKKLYFISEKKYKRINTIKT